MIALSTVMAQEVSVNGRFQADFVNGCAPLKVVITEIDTFPPETVRQYDFQGDGIFVGFEPGEEVSYTYSDPGNYRIVQVINIDIVPKTDTLELEVNESSNPNFTVFTCEDHAVKVEIDPDTYDQHKLYFTGNDSMIINQGSSVPVYTYPPGTHSITVKGLYNSGKENCGVTTKSFRTVENLIPAGINSVTVQSIDGLNGSVRLTYDLNPDISYNLEKAENLPGSFLSLGQLSPGSTDLIVDSVDTRNTIQLFRISAFDACQGQKIYSNTVSTVVLDVEAENSQNRVSWETYSGDFDRYEVYRDDSLLETILNEGRTSLVDNQVSCFTEYCYSVSYRSRAGAVSLSDTICVEAFKIYFPPPIKNTTVSVSDRQVDLTWTVPDNIEATAYFIQRRLSEDVYSTLDTVQETNYTDMDVDVVTGRECYRISYLDECQNRSNLGDLACSVNLQIEDNRLLRWNDYAGWLEGINGYTLEVYDDEGNLIDEIIQGTDNVYEIDNYIRSQINEYRIRIESRDQPPLIAYSNFVRKQIESVLWMPNAFSPNGDDLNDRYKPEGTRMSDFNMKIYSRNGHLIFETEDQSEGWDGTFDGTEMPFNTYIYKVEAVDELGKKYDLTGKLILIRD